MLNGLDLFSGIGGLSIALAEWIRPIAYCEIDPYCQAVLLSRQNCGDIMSAPIWSDVTTLEGHRFSHCTDIIYGGFPCQDISVAGRGKGLEGERSGLFFEIVRLAKEIKPKFIFLENVPAITSRGGLRVVREIAEMGYDCRWCVISAASIGALHRRERWFLLAHHLQSRRWEVVQSTYADEVQDEKKHLLEPVRSCGGDSSQVSPNASSLRCDKRASEGIHSERKASKHEESSNNSCKILNHWQNTEPPICGVDDGVSHRVHRIRALGNAVVPQQAKEAFKVLMGYK